MPLLDAIRGCVDCGIKCMMFKIESDNEEEFEDYYRGPEYMSALYEIKNRLRDKVKYTEEKGSFEKAYEIVLDTLMGRYIDI
jgi:hypothetical protein